ncbi:FAD-linked oxidase [Afipia sp. Root123D2]|uniref:FAD-binding oxidoreductase n=1 Tax=Afipia sp. Root123D2 TaxID=1736436 RepID=UPI0006F25A9E|nr:FAD-binding oxidoreductase [Afipia sp. Root123D2]KQW22024.1 FAD-linked oxidase [Afipia sp. Root123D2]
MTASTIAKVRDTDHVDADLASAFGAIVGSANVLTSFDERLGYSRDRLPFAVFRERVGEIAGAVPRLVVRPGNPDEIVRVVQLAKARNVPVIPYGNGSGVLGGAIPLGGEIMVDTRRLDKIISINPTDAVVTVQAGTNGADFERQLNEAGYTSGHLPQSIEISTVGGWLACRGGGQLSSRYGKIEDIVVGLKAVLPDGAPLEVRPVARRAVGPSIRDLMIGSEGTLGIITEATLRIFRKPAVERGVVLAFPSLQAALDSARLIMQAELRPSIVRLYDRVESDERTKDIALFKTKPFLAVLQFAGSEPVVTAEQDMALEIAAAQGGEVGPDGPYQHWRQNRYVAYSQKWHDAGYFNDTIEVTGNWSSIPAMYDAIGKAVRAIHSGVHFGAHWSHVYPEGACQYMTVRLPPMPEAQALPIHEKLWDAVQQLTLDHGGSISHHHGAGLFRNPWMKRELGSGLAVLQAIKDALDPGNLFNPGKIGLRASANAKDIRRD